MSECPREESRGIHLEYLSELEKRDAGRDPEEMILWPRTPIGGDHQDKIWERVGVSDRDVEDPRARPSMIGGHLRVLQQENRLTADFSLG